MNSVRNSEVGTVGKKLIGGVAAVVVALSMGLVAPSGAVSSTCSHGSDSLRTYVWGWNESGGHHYHAQYHYTYVWNGAGYDKVYSHTGFPEC